MNAGNGLRRFGLAVGVLGGCAGMVLAGLEAREIYRHWKQHEAFQSLATSPLIQQEVANVKAVASESTLYPQRKQTPAYYLAIGALNGSPEGWPVNKEDIARIHFVHGAISAIDKAGGLRVVDADLPEASTYVFTLMLPLLGFLMPRGIVQAFAWVFSGTKET
jgi:hypothetical protein